MSEFPARTIPTTPLANYQRHGSDQLEVSCLIETIAAGWRSGLSYVTGREWEVDGGGKSSVGRAVSSHSCPPTVG